MCKLDRACLGFAEMVIALYASSDAKDHTSEKPIAKPATARETRLRVIMLVASDQVA